MEFQWDNVVHLFKFADSELLSAHNCNVVRDHSVGSSYISENRIWIGPSQASNNLPVHCAPFIIIICLSTYLKASWTCYTSPSLTKLVISPTRSPVLTDEYLLILTTTVTLLLKLLRLRTRNCHTSYLMPLTSSATRGSLAHTKPIPHIVSFTQRLNEDGLRMFTFKVDITYRGRGRELIFTRFLGLKSRFQTLVRVRHSPNTCLLLRFLNYKFKLRF